MLGHLSLLHQPKRGEKKKKKKNLTSEDALRTHSEHLAGEAGQECSSQASSVTERYRHSTLKPVNYSFHVKMAYL